MLVLLVLLIALPGGICYGIYALIRRAVSDGTRDAAKTRTDTRRDQ